MVTKFNVLESLRSSHVVNVWLKAPTLMYITKQTTSKLVKKILDLRKLKIMIVWKIGLPGKSLKVMLSTTIGLKIHNCVRNNCVRLVKITNYTRRGLARTVINYKITELVRALSLVDSCV